MKVYLSLFLILALILTPTFGASLGTRMLAATTSASNNVSVLASISWGSNSSSRRIYSVENGKVIEHANDGGTWYIGTFPQPAGVSVAAVYILAGIRVYVTGTDGVITEWCYDLTSSSNGKWTTGSNIGSGTVLSAAADQAYTKGPYCVFYVYARYNGTIVENSWAYGWGSNTLPSSSNI